jgi:hypothetical protein
VDRIFYYCKQWLLSSGIYGLRVPSEEYNVTLDMLVSSEINPGTICKEMVSFIPIYTTTYPLSCNSVHNHNEIVLKSQLPLLF